MKNSKLKIKNGCLAAGGLHSEFLIFDF